MEISCRLLISVMPQLILQFSDYHLDFQFISQSRNLHRVTGSSCVICEQRPWPWGTGRPGLIQCRTGLQLLPALEDNSMLCPKSTVTARSQRFPCPSSRYLLFVWGALATTALHTSHGQYHKLHQRSSIQSKQQVDICTCVPLDLALAFHDTGMSQKLMRFSPSRGDKVLSGPLEAHRQCSAKGLCLAGRAGSHATAMRQHEKVPRRNHREGGKGMVLAPELNQYSRLTSQWISSTLQKTSGGLTGATMLANEHFLVQITSCGK